MTRKTPVAARRTGGGIRRRRSPALRRGVGDRAQARRRGSSGVRVQEQEHVAARGGGAGVHLRRAAARRFAARVRTDARRASRELASRLPPSTAMTSASRCMRSRAQARERRRQRERLVENGMITEISQFYHRRDREITIGRRFSAANRCSAHRRGRRAVQVPVVVDPFDLVRVGGEALRHLGIGCVAGDVPLRRPGARGSPRRTT